ncbi:MAG: hypothetical protein K6F69_05385 [Treponema sp.]|nr:hypothetical protein [Treponema sp.]
MKTMVKRFIILASSITLFTACNNKKVIVPELKVNAEGAIQLEIHPASKESLQDVQKWHPTEDKVCVVLGYGYNEGATKDEIIANLSNKYGLSEDGGLIVPVVYPDDFLHSGKIRLSTLKDVSEDYQLKGFIILGAPEDTNKALTRIEDANGGKRYLPVFAFFSQDDVSGMEAACDFIVDHIQSNSTTESAQIIEADIQTLVNNSIDYMLALDGPLIVNEELIQQEQQKNLFQHVQQIVGKNRNLAPAIDDETGFSSANHFVIK